MKRYVSMIALIPSYQDKIPASAQKDVLRTAHYVQVKESALNATHYSTSSALSA